MSDEILRSYAEIGSRYGLNENAARMRVERALEKLRALLAKRGVTTTAALASVISTCAVQAAPAGLAATLTTASLASASAGTLGLWSIMNMTKLKLALGALVVVGASTALTVQHQNNEILRAANETFRQQVAQLEADNQSFSNRAALAAQAVSSSKEQFDELLRLRNEVGMLRDQTNELAHYKELQRKLVQAQSSQPDAFNQLSPGDQYILRQRYYSAATMKILRGMQNYAESHNGEYPANFDELLASGLLPATNFEGNITLNDFEFLKPGVVDGRGRKVYFRGRNAIVDPSGSQVWVYGEFTDGRPSGMMTSRDFVAEPVQPDELAPTAK